MRKLRGPLCALCLALLIPLLLRARQVLPMDTHPLVAEKYAGWSGVLRLWVFEGWQSGAGSVSAWLNGCIARFEKRNPGVYIQPTFVDAGALAGMNDSGIARPDMILFPPTLLDAPAGLAAISPPEGLRAGLDRVGLWHGQNYAVPVALGGYMWAWNATRADGLPSDWSDGGADALAAPPPEAFQRWDAALLTLCAGLPHATDVPSGEGDALPGLDLGLGGIGATPAPAPTADAPAPPCRLPEGFQWDGDAWRRFINGEVSAIPLTQREVRRLQALSAQGKGPDWRLTAGGIPFTDQLLALGICVRGGNDPRPTLCEAFLALLLSENCQGELHRAGAFAVTGASSGYDRGDPLAALDEALRSGAVIAPNLFDKSWGEYASGIVREFISEDGDARVLWPRLAARLAENPNID